MLLSKQHRLTATSSANICTCDLTGNPEVNRTNYLGFCFGKKKKEKKIKCSIILNQEEETLHAFNGALVVISSVSYEYYLYKGIRIKLALHH